VYALTSFVVFIVGDSTGIHGSLYGNFACLHPPHCFTYFLDVGKFYVFVFTFLNASSKCSNYFRTSTITNNNYIISPTT